MSDFTIRVFPEPVPKTPAGRMGFLQELLTPPIYCECGCDCIVGYGEPMIDREAFLELVSTSAIPEKK